MKLQEALDVYCKHLSGVEERKIFSKLKETDFSASIHYPIIYLYLHYSQLEKAEFLLNKSDSTNDETYLELKDLLEALKETNFSNSSVFPLSTPWREWKNGPHLDFPNEIAVNDYEYHKLIKWFPGSVIYVEGKKVGFTFGEISGGGIDYADVEIDLDKLKELVDDKFIDEIIKLDGKEEVFSFFVELVEYENGKTMMKKYNLDDCEWPTPKIREMYNIVLPVIKARNLRLREFQESFYKDKT